MFANEELQRWAGRICLLLVAALGMMGYHFANVRFLPLDGGLRHPGRCLLRRRGRVSAHARPLRDSGQHPATLTCRSPGSRSAKRSSAPATSTGRP